MRILVLAPMLAIVGCAGLNYATDNYRGTPVESFAATSGITYRIFDQPDRYRMMITPELRDSVSRAAVRGATRGIIGGGTPVIYRDAAEEYLSSKGRDCRAIDTTLITDPQYEVRYRCSGT